MLSLNCKHVQHVKMCLPCNFEVNSVTHFGVIPHFNGLQDLLQNCMVDRSWHAEHVCSLNLTFISNSFWNKGRKVLKCWKFDEKMEITPKWVTGFTSKLHGRQILTCWTCLQLQTCLACQDLLTMQFWSKFHYLFWSYFPFFIKFSTF
jgi:hypothetical protein